MIPVERWDCLDCHLVMLPRKWQGRIYCSECSSVNIRPHLEPRRDGLRISRAFEPRDTRFLADRVTGA